MSVPQKNGPIGAVILACAAALVLLVGCKPTTPWAQSSALTNQSSQRPQNAVTAHDLSGDESLGGHTLKRHVGRTDEQLEARLRHEPNISAASTYTDRATAERVIADALTRNESRIFQWSHRDRHPNLVLEYDGDQPIGRTLNRGNAQPQPCSHAVVVLRWDGPNEYHVLTSYPECR